MPNVKTNKKRVVVKLQNMPEELQEEVRKQYPYGFTDHMMRIDKGPGDFFYAVVFETEDTNYLVKIDVKPTNKRTRLWQRITNITTTGR